MKRTILSFATLFLAAAVFAQTKPASYNDVLKSQLKGSKTEIVSQLLGVDFKSNPDFSKLYGEFQDKLLANGEKRFKLIEDYLNHSNNITGDYAKSLIDQMLKVDSERTKIMSKYSKKLGKYLSPQNTLTLLQFENKLRALVDAKLAANIPFANMN
jgi:hypothetical protein